MVKYDHFPGVVSWLVKIGVLLPLTVGLYVLWEIFSTWRSLDPVNKGLAICEVIVALGMGFLAGKALLQGEEWKQLKRVEALRRNQEEAVLYHTQPETEEAKGLLPITLSMHLSPVVYLGFTIFWFVVLGEALYLMSSSADATGSRGIYIMVWIMLGGIIIGLAGIGTYQRIEATPQGLVVQRGLKRRTILWEQARLFAAVRLTSPDCMPVQYELSSPRTLLRWSARYPASGIITSPRQPQAYEQRLCDLLSAIRLHTGLPLLDLH